MTLNPPGTVREIVQQLERAGFEAWCVGGAVRDALLGMDHLDWDIATSARPEEVRRIFRRTVPLGIEFGTVGVLDKNGVMHEVTTFRRDVETDGRHARVVFGVSLEEDLARRDFTINSVAYSPSRDEIRDPFDGQKDIARGVVKTVGDPDERMTEDRLRSLRALRFAARFGFEIDPPTWASVTRSAPFLQRLSAERIRQEIEKTMDQVRRPSSAFRLWRECGAFARVIPALASSSDLELTYPDFLALPVLKGRPGRRSNRITALFLTAGPHRAATAFRDLRFSNSGIAWMAALVERWSADVPLLERSLEGGHLPDAGFTRRWIAGVGRMRAATLLRIAIAVWCARAEAGLPAPPSAMQRALYGRVLRSAFRDPVDIGDLQIDGDDLHGIGIGAGPIVGRILKRLLDLVLDNPALNERATLMRMAQNIARTDGGGDGPPQRRPS